MEDTREINILLSLLLSEDTLRYLLMFLVNKQLFCVFYCRLVALNGQVLPNSIEPNVLNASVQLHTGQNCTLWKTPKLHLDEDI
jgi:hypothetical protein